MLDDIVTEPIREHLPRKRRDSYPRAFALQDIAEVFEIGVTTAHDGVLELECRDVGATDDFVRGVHVPRCAMGLGVSDLEKFGLIGFENVSRGRGCSMYDIGVGWGEIVCRATKAELNLIERTCCIFPLKF